MTVCANTASDGKASGGIDRVHKQPVRRMGDHAFSSLFNRHVWLLPSHRLQRQEAGDCEVGYRPKQGSLSQTRPGADLFVALSPVTVKDVPGVT